MKTQSTQGTQPSHGGSIAARFLLAFTLLVPITAIRTRAAVPMTTYTASGQQVAVGYPGDRLALPGGEQLRNQLQILKVDSTDVRVAGRRILLTHGLKKTDGTSELFGTWIGEPGTWVAGVFTPSGGLWDGTWRGIRQTDGSLAMTLTALGRGGSFDGLELKETLARAGGPEFDPALRFDMIGRTAPTNGWVQTIFADDFEDGAVEPAWRPLPGGDPPKNNRPRLEERNGKLTLYLDPTTESAVDAMVAVFSVGRPVSLQDGQTLELRLDVAGMTGTTSQLRGAGLSLVETLSPEVLHGYSAVVTPVVAVLNKDIGGDTELSPRYAGGSYYRAGLTLILLVTRLDSNTAKLRFQVVDRNQNGKVIYDASWTDTPASDPVDDGSDIEAPPFLSFIEAGFFFGFAPTPPQPPPKNLSLTIDNFSLRVFESSIAELQVERAVLLTPPPSASPYVVEGAPTVHGPWTPLSAPEVQIHGVRHLLVPVSENPGLGFFRGH